jgi:hypothetical protein
MRHINAVRLKGLGRLLIKPHKQLIAGLNSAFNKLKKRPKRVRDIAVKLLVR